MDKQQRDLITLLENKAYDSQMQRNNAQDLFDIAVHKSQQPNKFILNKHLLPFAIAGFIGASGVYMELKQGVQYASLAGAGIGLLTSLASNSRDDARQTREKGELVSRAKLELETSESKLAKDLQTFNTELEIGYLMWALDITKAEVFSLQEWMSDPRRTMKDAILTSIDIVILHYLQQTLDVLHIESLVRERRYRSIRDKLMSEETQLNKDDFMSQVVTKNHLLQAQEARNWLKESATIVATASALGGTAAGLAAGAATAGIVSGIAGAIGSSKDAVRLGGTLGGAAAVVAIGALAASSITEMMKKGEPGRRQQEMQKFHDSFTITNSILEMISHSQSASNADKVNAAKKALLKLDAFKNNELKNQDKPMKEYVDILRCHLKQFLGEPQDVNLLGQVSKFFGGLLN
ncbi:hypothetical protein CLI64_20945 [Nostoc sp. CENA543]|uniref:hypothetical protein n=1 Tax=Nostoc sp. CENA543 TaxID=1869241 RepID=UPI000CA25A14|nr:hypothetical protein [Nostoc sp. CENA543]AUT02661.1 hypothetical protein CLI64_20945 [Nostoc sp. CENA543]